MTPDDPISIEIDTGLLKELLTEGGAQDWLRERMEERYPEYVIGSINWQLRLWSGPGGGVRLYADLHSDDSFLRDDSDDREDAAYHEMRDLEDYA